MSSNEETSDSPQTLSTVDYIVLGISLVIPFAIAVWTAFKNKNTTQDFFTAKKSMGPVPVAMSILSTFITGYMILVYSSEVYGYGLEYSVVILGGLIGIPVCTYMNLKVFYDLKVTTVYEYIERRYHSFALRVCLMLIEVTRRMINMGIALCGSCLALAAVTPVHVNTYIYILGILCAFYATIGGMRGVIWTDFFMMIVMVIGLVAIIVVGCLQIGPSEIWRIASEGGRTRIFNFNPNLYQRQNFYLLIIHGFLVYGKQYGSDQLSLQRALSLRSFTEYKSVLAILISGFTIMHVLMFGAGLTAYAIYVGCDPLTEGKMQKIDQILPYLINDKMRYLPGISGLFVSAMVCAGVSSVSSFMNVFSNLMYADLLCNFQFFKKLSERTSLIICKSMTALMAIPAISLAIVVTTSRSILAIVFISFGVLIGPTLGIFFMALLLPMSKLIGAVVGFSTSLGFLTWIATGWFLYRQHDEYLPLSDELCNSDFYSGNGQNATLISEYLHSLSIVNKTVVDAQADETTSLYGVSYLFFSVFGPIICIVVGMSFSYITGPQKIESVPKELISPFVRNFFYKNKKEQFVEEMQTKM